MRIRSLFSGKYLHKRAVILAFCWVGGLLLGCLLGTVSDGNHRIVVLAAGKRPNYLGMLPARLWFLALVAFAAYLSKERWIYFFCLLRMYLFGHTVFLVRSAFGTSSWLVNSILMLPSVMLLVPTFWFCLRRLTVGLISIKKDFIRAVILICLVTAFDAFVIAPFLETVVI